MRQHFDIETTQPFAILSDMETVIFETHATSLDNEAALASGLYDVGLSALGRREAADLGRRYHGVPLAAVCYPDLRRAVDTVKIAFGGTGFPFRCDRRLRECDYGDLTRSPISTVEREKSRRITEPFPNGQSYTQTTDLMGDFLRDVVANSGSGQVLIVGCRATQYGLDYWLNGRSLRDAVATPLDWQPGWNYEVTTEARDRLFRSR
ncbi:MAG: histidine phosphatase family protein [Thermomicrobiales bacterium]